MTKVNHGEGEVMAAQKVDSFAIKTDQQSAKLVHPGEGALAGKAALVHLGVKQAFASAPGRFTVAFVFSHVGDKAMIEADFAPIARIEGAIGVEDRPSNGQPQPLHPFEGGLKLGF